LTAIGHSPHLDRPQEWQQHDWKAQAMRAVLFANATATTSGGRLRRSRITHGSALVAFKAVFLRL
jgi:hypothetical protein